MTSDRGAVIRIPSGTPEVHEEAWVAPGAVVVGNVRLLARVGVYYGAVLRAEGAAIEVGERSNVQDNCVLHAGLEHHLRIGAGVTVGHAAVVHGCTVEDDCLIGMGAVLLNDCHVGAGSVVAAGALVPEGVRIPPGSLVVGRPGRVVRQLDAADRDEVRWGAEHYLGLLEEHRRGTTVLRDADA